MIATLLKELSLKDLIDELINREKQLAISRTNRADNHLIEFNKNQLATIQKAILDKTDYRTHVGKFHFHHLIQQDF